MASPIESTQPFRWQYAEFDDADFQVRGHTLFFIVLLFSIILLVTLIFHYARWVCNVDSPPPPSPSPPPPPTISATTAPPRGLDPITINSLPIVMYKSSVSDAGIIMETECCICLGIFGDGDKVKELPRCKHVFHSECVDKWLHTQSSCPLCRASLRAVSPV